MKLSEKGFKALLHKVRSGFFWGYEDDIHKAKDHDFKPDDFKGVVCLTVEEAKEAIGDYIDVVAEVVRQRNEPEIKIKHPKSILRLTERIEQAEGKDE